jgi:hypothetical protein
MTKMMTAREAAERIEQFGDELAALLKAFDKDCDRMPSNPVVDRINEIENQDSLDTIATAFQKLGSEMSSECDAAEEADDRRRDNPLERDFRRLGQ